MKNLRKITNDLKIVLAQTNDICKDWDEKKRVHSGNYGYLNLVINHPEILKETKIIKQLVKSFNKSREKMWKYKDLILNYKRGKLGFINVKPLTIKNPIDTSDTVKRLTKRISPDNEEDFKVISHRAFHSAHIRELLTEWEKDPSTPIIHNEATSEVIDNLKYDYPYLQKWDNHKIINRISDNWKKEIKFRSR